MDLGRGASAGGFPDRGLSMIDGQPEADSALAVLIVALVIVAGTVGVVLLIPRILAAL
jgi:hypothetical protein